MQYFEQFRGEVPQKVRTLFTSIKTLTSQVANGKKRLADEQANSKGIEAQVQKLKKLSGDSLTGDKHEFEKFKSSLRQRDAEFAASSEAVRLLRDEILPTKQKQLEEAKVNVKILLDSYMLRSRSAADAEINKLLAACINERQDFLDSFTKIYADFGLTLVISDEAYCPGPWTAEEIKNLRGKLGMDVPAPSKSHKSEVRSQKSEVRNLNTEKTGLVPDAGVPQGALV